MQRFGCLICQLVWYACSFVRSSLQQYRSTHIPATFRPCFEHGFGVCVTPMPFSCPRASVAGFNNCWHQKKFCQLALNCKVWSFEYCSHSGKGNFVAPISPWFKRPFLSISKFSSKFKVLKIASTRLVLLPTHQSQKNHGSVVALLPGKFFILHLLLGLCWDEVWNCWDRSQLSPSQTPTNHPSGFI